MLIIDPGQDIVVQENEQFSLSSSTIAKSYTWSEGETVLGTGKVLSGVSLNPGIHTITLKVMYDNGVEATANLKVKVNKLPKVVIEGNTTNIWGEDITFDGSKSYDEDGNIVDFECSNGVSTKISTYENLPLGNNEIKLTLTDNDGGVADGKVSVKTVMCAGEETIELLKDVNGTVNMEPHTNHVSCYKINLSSSNGTEFITLPDALILLEEYLLFNLRIHL